MTRRFSRGLLRRYLCGTLSPWRSALIEEAADADPSLRATLEALAIEDTAPTVESPAWLLPPAGIQAGPPSHFSVQIPEHLGEARPLVAWERFVVQIGPVPDGAERSVVVLLRQEDTWTVLSPSEPGEELNLVDLPQGTDGRVVLRLPAQPTPGLQRWAIVLPYRTDCPDWSLPPKLRWRGLQAMMRSDEVPVFTFEIEVAEMGG